MGTKLLLSKRVLCVTFGDSITEGYGASDESHRWANIVTTTKGWTLINSGIGGTNLQNTVQTSLAVIGGATVNNGRDTYTTRITAYEPTKVIILYGFNDLLLNDEAYSDTLFANDLGEIIDGLTSTGIAAVNILIGSPPYMPEASYTRQAPPRNGGSRIKHAAYTAACASVAAAKGCKYADVYQYMADNGGDTLIGGDGFHPNDAGYAAIATAILAEL